MSGTNISSGIFVSPSISFKTLDTTVEDEFTKTDYWKLLNLSTIDKSYLDPEAVELLNALNAPKKQKSSSKIETAVNKVQLQSQIQTISDLDKKSESKSSPDQRAVNIEVTTPKYQQETIPESSSTNKPFVNLANSDTTSVSLSASEKDPELAKPNYELEPSNKCLEGKNTITQNIKNNEMQYANIISVKSVPTPDRTLPSTKFLYDEHIKSMNHSSLQEAYENVTPLVSPKISSSGAPPTLYGTPSPQTEKVQVVETKINQESSRRTIIQRKKKEELEDEVITPLLCKEYRETEKNITSKPASIEKKDDSEEEDSYQLPQMNIKNDMYNLGPTTKEIGKMIKKEEWKRLIERADHILRETSNYTVYFNKNYNANIVQANGKNYKTYNDNSKIEAEVISGISWMSSSLNDSSLALNESQRLYIENKEQTTKYNENKPKISNNNEKISILKIKQKFSDLIKRLEDIHAQSVLPKVAINTDKLRPQKADYNFNEVENSLRDFKNKITDLIIEDPKESTKNEDVLDKVSKLKETISRQANELEQLNKENAVLNNYIKDLQMENNRNEILIKSQQSTINTNRSLTDSLNEFQQQKQSIGSTACSLAGATVGGSGKDIQALILQEKKDYANKVFQTFLGESDFTMLKANEIRQRMNSEIIELIQTVSPNTFYNKAETTAPINGNNFKVADTLRWGQDIVGIVENGFDLFEENSKNINIRPDIYLRLTKKESLEGLVAIVYIINYVCGILKVSSVSGIIPKLSKIMISMGTTDNLLYSIKDALSLPQNALGNKIIDVIKDLVSRSSFMQSTTE